jgi:hypothetical protein
MGRRMYNYLGIIVIRIFMRIRCSNCPRCRIQVSHQNNPDLIRMVVRFKFHRAPRGRAPPHKTSRIGVHSETQVSRCLCAGGNAPHQLKIT